METKTLNKYDKSRLNGVLIRQIDIYKNGKIKIIAENNTSKEFYLNEDIVDYSADYIICELQDNEDIIVSKY